MTELRHDFPLTGKVDYLNTAGVGLIPAPVVREMQRFIARHMSRPPYEEGFFEALKMVEETRRAFAEFIQCHPDNLSFQANSSTAISLVSEVIPWKRGDEVIIDDLQFPSDIYPWVNLASRGVKLRIVKSREGDVDESNFQRAIGKRTKLVAVSFVSFVNGFTHDLTSMGELAREHDAYFLVDATHGAGYLDIDVGKCHTDFLVTSNYKWLLSTFGAAELYMQKDWIQDARSPHVGWFSNENYTNAGKVKTAVDRYTPAHYARKFEPGNLDYLSIFCLAKSLRYMRKVGFRKITDRTRELHEYLVTGLLALGAELLTPIRGKTWSALVFCRLPGMNGTRLARLLGEKKIFVTSRVFKNFDGIRISPYFYNTEEDIDRLLGELKRIKSR